MKFAQGKRYLEISVKTVFAYIAQLNHWKDSEKAAEEFINSLGTLSAYSTMKSFRKSTRNLSRKVITKPKSGPKSMTKSIPKRKSSTKRNSASSLRRRYVGGALPLMKYVNWIIGAAVGTFDTPCNIIISQIAIATYCVMAYTFIVSMQRHDNNIAEAVNDDIYKHSMASPVQYIIYNKFPQVYEVQESIFSSVQRHIKDNVLSKINVESLRSVDGASIVQTMRSFFYEPNLYKIFVVKAVSCVLAPLITSCAEHCPGL